MRIVAFVLSVAIGLAALAAATVAVPELGIATGVVVPFIVALVTLWAVGLFTGIVPVVSVRDPATPDGRRASRVFTGTAGAIALAATLLLVVPAVSGGIPVGVAAGTVASGALFIAANAIGGQYLRRRADARRIPPFPIPPLDPDYSRQRARTVVIVSTSVLVVGVLFALVAGRPADAEPDVHAGIARAISLASFLATLMCAVFGVALSGRSRELSRQDAASLKRINRVVLRGKATPLTDEELAIAAAYAPYAAQAQRWSLAQSLAIVLAVLTLNRPSADHPLQLAIWIVLPVLAAIVIPLGVRASGRAERYALEHRGTRSAGPSVTDPAQPSEEGTA